MLLSVTFYSLIVISFVNFSHHTFVRYVSTFVYCFIIIIIFMCLNFSFSCLDSDEDENLHLFHAKTSLCTDNVKKIYWIIHFKHNYLLLTVHTFEH